MNVGFLTNRCEFAEPKPYSGKGELLFAIAGCVIWFSAIVVRLSISPKSWTLTETLFEAASFVLAAGVPIFFLATHPGTKFAERVLLKNNGLWFQTLTCLFFGAYIALGNVLELNSSHFSWLKQFNHLIMRDSFWLNVGLFLVGTFIVLRLPFLLLHLRDRSIPAENHAKEKKPITSAKQQKKENKQNGQILLFLVANFVYISLVQTSLVSTALKSENSGYFIGFAYFVIGTLMALPFVKATPSHRMMVFDLLLATTCLLSLFWFSRPAFSFGPFIGLTLFVLVVIHGTGLGREHFGYSFQLRKADVLYTAKAILTAALILVPLALLLKFGHSEPASVANLSAIANAVLFFLSYAVLFSFRVGLFEEILFRSGLMVFIRDQLQTQTGDRLKPKQLVLLSAVLCSVIFGVAHIGNNPGAGMTLSPLQYKAIYAALATLASLFYSLAVGETNRLWSAITIHGIVDTTAVVLLGASLVVPF